MPAGVTTSNPDPANVFGVAHVDGKYFLTKEDFLDEGAGQILATGTKVIKLYLTPRRYPWNSAWPKNLHSLVDVARTPYFKSVFAMPFNTYMLTAFSLGREDHYWTDGISDEQAADETRQFYDLTRHLLATYKGTGKTFILQNWEGDWAIRHGSPKPYDAGYTPTPTAVKGMIRWFNARQAGIVKGRLEVPDTDVHVYGAVEVNRVEDSMAGKPGVANAVLPHTSVDLASYSCYNFLDTTERLGQAVDYIAAHLPPTAIFGRNAHSVYLGEYGYPENGREGLEGLNRRMDNAAAVVNAKGLPWAAFWEVYCNEPLPGAPQPPLNGRQNDQNLRGYWMVKPDGTPGLAWNRFRRLFATTDPDRATTTAIKSHLTESFRDDFNRGDGRDLGAGWTEASHYGKVDEQLLNHRMRFDIPDGHAIPWGSATLALKKPLHAGDYFEITLRRLSQEGGLGIEVFDSDQLRVGSDLNSGPTQLKAWNGTTWVPVAFDDGGHPVTFNWNTPRVVGVRFEYADGHRTVFSYYIDGNYAGSWLINTANTMLDKIGVYAQSKTSGASFEFADLRVFARE